MRILLFKENNPIAPEYLQSLFLGDEEIIKKLNLAKILKHKIPKIDFGEVFVEDADESRINKEYYSFNFVGVLIVENFCLVVYPKYIKDIEKDYKGSQKKIIQILSVIEKFQVLNEYHLSSDENDGSILTLMIQILKNFLEDGLYSSDETVVETNGEGNILWEKTIDESTVCLVDNTPFYLDMFTEKNVLNELNIIRKLHAAIVNEISVYLQPILSIFGIPEIILSTQELDDFGDINYLEYLLEQELSRQFVTSKQIVLKELLNYIIKINEQENDGCIEIYGTTSFNLVWEHICKKVYKDDLNRDLSTLGIELYHEIEKNGKKETVIDYRDKKLLKNVVETPIWSKTNSITGILANKSLELDVLHINHEKKCFEIFDGKYYSTTFSNGKIFGQPGVSDITKQYLYQLAFKKLAQVNNYDFSNTFVIPKDELKNDTGFGVDYAKVEFQMLSELGLENVRVIARDCEIFYDQYLTM